MIEKSFAPADPARPATPKPRYPEETPAIVRRYLWPALPAAEPAPARTETASPPQPQGPRP